MLRNLCRARTCSTAAAASRSSVFSATLIERRPVILPDPAEHEERFWAIQEHIHRIRAAPLPDELLAQALREQERMAEERGKAQDFVPAPRRTAADESNDIRSLDRALDRTLYLMLQEAGGWQFPTRELGEGDKLITAAAKAVEDTACTVSFIAQAPIAHLERPDGAKVFIHLAELLPTKKSAYDVSHLEERGDKFAWLTKEEVMDGMEQDKDVLEYVLSH